MNTIDKLYSNEIKKGRLQIKIIVIPIGDDLQIFISGGKAHIGAIALGSPYNITKATASVIAAPKHKENQLALNLAELLSKNLQLRVAVTMGIHFDNISSKELTDIKEIVSQLGEMLLDKLKTN